jgi:hypothetical protein
MPNHRFTAALAAALATGAVVAPAGWAKPPDLNGPLPPSAGLSHDLRAPDQRDDRGPGNKPYTAPSTKPFSGSVSTSDGGAGATGQQLSTSASSPAVSGSSSDGFEWGSAAAGAGAALAIVLAGLGGRLAISRRRGAPGAKPTTVAAGH